VRSDARVLVVGVGGLGCPCALALVRAGVFALRLCDDDVVEESNLHRQILFDDESIGKLKLEEAKRTLASHGATVIELARTRFLPSTAKELLDGCDLVVEGADNFATKFLVADACALTGVPVVHAAAVRVHGTALAVGPHGGPCYRCLFEDVPRGEAANCVSVGVLGPMVGVVGALQADLALGMLDGRDVAGTLVTYDAETDVLRRARMSARSMCPLCGSKRRIDALDERRYISVS
jgi:molybdopterin/thiamine biosynthesis adenylyltransferase